MIFCNRSDCNRRVAANQTRWKHSLNQIKQDFNHIFKSLRHAVVPGLGFVVTARLATLGRLRACLTFGLLHLSFLCWSIFYVLPCQIFAIRFIFTLTSFQTLFVTPTSRPDLPKFAGAAFPSSLIATSLFRRHEPPRDGGALVQSSGEWRRRNKAHHLFSSYDILDHF